MAFLRQVVVVGIVLVTGLALAVPASAHTTLRSANPASGSTVAPPSKILLEYDDPVMLPRVVLTDTGGGRHQAGAAKAVDNKVTQEVADTLPGGTYTVAWRIVATDGHPVEGSYKFTVKSAPSGSATPAAAPAATPADKESGGSSGWLWVGLAAIVVVLVGGGITVVRRRLGSKG